MKFILFKTNFVNFSLYFGYKENDDDLLEFYRLTLESITTKP